LDFLNTLFQITRIIQFGEVPISHACGRDMTLQPHDKPALVPAKPRQWRRIMLRKIIVAAAAVSILAGTAISANSQSRHHSRFEYAPSYGDNYMHERSDPTNTNGD
jgi:hypothetical protein